MNKHFFLILTIALIGCKEKENELKVIDRGLLWAISWSPSGEYISAGGNQDTLRIFSAKDFKIKNNYPLHSTITKLKWHPTEEKLAIATQTSDEKSRIIDFRRKNTVVLENISLDGARGIGWNFDGTLLAVGDNDGMLVIFDENGKFIKAIESNQKAITDLSWHPTKNVIVTVGSQIGIYDYGKDIILNIKPRKHEILMLCVSWHPSGSFFVTGDYGDLEKNYPAMLQFWNATGKNIRNIGKSKLEYRNLKWSKNGEILATASDYVRLWNKSGNLIKEKKSDGILWGIDWNPNGTNIITSDNMGRVTVWDKDLNIINELSY